MVVQIEYDSVDWIDHGGVDCTNYVNKKHG